MKLKPFLMPVLVLVVLLAFSGSAFAQCATGCAAPVRAQAVQIQQYHVAPAAVAVPVAVVAVPSAPLVQLQVQPYYHAAPAAVQAVVVQRQVVQQVKVQAVQVHAAPQRVVQRSVLRAR